MSRNTRILLVVVAFFATSLILVARDDAELGVTETDSGPDIHEVDSGDPEMNAAIDKARSTVGRFVQRLPALRSGGAFFAVKYPLSENAVTEHVWIHEPDFDGENFSGYLASEPISLPSWSYGDRVSVAPDVISDWLAVTDGTLYGGFTLHVFRRRMTEEERQVLYDGLGTPLPDNPVVWN